MERIKSKDFGGGTGMIEIKYLMAGWKGPKVKI